MNYCPESVSREVSNFLQFHKAVEGNLYVTMRTVVLRKVCFGETDSARFAGEAAMLLGPLSVDTFPNVWREISTIHVEVAVSEETRLAILRYLKQ